MLQFYINFIHNIYLHQHTNKIFYFILFVLIFLHKFLYLIFKFQISNFFLFHFYKYLNSLKTNANATLILKNEKKKHTKINKYRK